MVEKTRPQGAGFPGRSACSASMGCTRTVRGQRGLSLIELMVGMAVGLLVITFAMVGLFASRSLSGTVNDASVLQQQASYAFRVIGQQVRPAGGLYLNLQQVEESSNLHTAVTPVVFETTAAADRGGLSFSPSQDRLTGTVTSLTVGYRRFKEPVFFSSDAKPLSRNCLGGPEDSKTDQRLESIFTINAAELRCGGNNTSTSAQPIIGNVANFQLRYLQVSGQNTGSPKIQYVDADTAKEDWSRITGVEVCLVLYGNEVIDMPTSPATGAGSSTYVDCDGTVINMTTLAAPRTKRMHMAFRNTFQLRSQGVL